MTLTFVNVNLYRLEAKRYDLKSFISILFGAVEGFCLLKCGKLATEKRQKGHQKVLTLSAVEPRI
jgi:hypothetical protein